MQPKHVGAGDLCEIAQSKKVIAFGAGRRLHNVAKRFEAYEIEKVISYVADNNPELWESNVHVNGVELAVHSPEYLRVHLSDDCIIVIMTVSYEEILKQLLSYKECANIDIFLSPETSYAGLQEIEEEYLKKPLENTIVANGEGDTHENALALYEYFCEHNLLGRYKWVWLCSHPEKYESTENVKYVRRDITTGAPTRQEVLDNLYALCTSKYIFYENIFLYKKRPEQIAVYLKHGTFMLKNVKGKITIPEEVYGAICTSHQYAALAEEQEGLSQDKLLFCGSPRLDYLYKNKKVLETLGAYEEGIKYVLWLPTMRQTVGLARNDVGNIAPFGIPIMTCDEEFTLLDETLGSLHMKLVIKPHPHQELSVYKIFEYRNIIFIPQAKLDENGFVIHSLMRECDALISDYSSIAFDYMLLDRPIGYTVDDMEDYKIGFSVEDPLYFMPGKKMKTIGEMLQFLSDVNENKDGFAENRREIRNYVHEFQNEKNCERFLTMMRMI